MSFCSLVLALVVGTWNGRWFPSGRAEHRADDAVERETIQAAGQMLRSGLLRVDPSGSDDVVLCLNEIRDRETAEALCREIGRTNLSVAVVTGYRRRDRFDQQQDAIITTLSIARANWSRWKFRRDAPPPRGYARAEVVVSPAVTAVVYAVHLKSNYGQTTEEEAATNRMKRAYAMQQLAGQERPGRGRRAMPVVVAGDFNVDRHLPASEMEATFSCLEAAGFRSVFEGVSREGRITYPGRRRNGGSTLDYILLRDCRAEGAPVVVPALRVSDHNAVFVRVAFDD